jgi:hypothetical protein
VTTERFNTLAGAVAQAMNTAHKMTEGGTPAGTFACPKCGSSVRYSGNLQAPHRTAGNCIRPGCVRWAAQ